MPVSSQDFISSSMAAHQWLANGDLVASSNVSGIFTWFEWIGTSGIVVRGHLASDAPFFEAAFACGVKG